MIRPAVGFALEGLKLYLVLSFLAWMTAVPQAVAHWAFAVLVSVLCMPGLMAGAARPPRGG